MTWTHALSGVWTVGSLYVDMLRLLRLFAKRVCVRGELTDFHIGACKTVSVCKMLFWSVVDGGGEGEWRLRQCDVLLRCESVTQGIRDLQFSGSGDWSYGHHFIANNKMQSSNPPPPIEPNRKRRHCLGSEQLMFLFSVWEAVAKFSRTWLLMCRQVIARTWRSARDSTQRKVRNDIYW